MNCIQEIKMGNVVERSDYSKQVRVHIIRIHLKIAKKFCSFLDIFSCVKSNVFRFLAQDAGQIQ